MKNVKYSNLMALSNEKAPSYKTYKKILQDIAEEIDPKTCQKVFRVIKKFANTRMN